MASNHPAVKIAVFVSFSGQGGVERMIVNLCEGLVALGCRVDLVLVKANSECLDALPPGVRIIKLHASHSLSSLPGLIRYLKREEPAAILAAKDRANQVAIVARRLARAPTRMVVRMGTTVSAALAGKSPFREWAWYLPMRVIYPMADAIVAVSRGVAADMKRITGLPGDRFQVIPNPVITRRLYELASEPVSHEWFGRGRPPVVIGSGRLTRQKDFPTLIRAFAAVRAERDCRLIILGEGKDRPALESLASDLGVRGDVDVPGFVDNPYAYVGRASLFVLSSAWEGSPNVLTEALALGVPSVATDCPSGPREILADGRYGPLVPVGDVDALAKAMLETLDNPLDGDTLEQAAAAYTVEASSRRYLEVLLGRSLE